MTPPAEVVERLRVEIAENTRQCEANPEHDICGWCESIPMLIEAATLIDTLKDALGKVAETDASRGTRAAQRAKDIARAALEGDTATPTKSASPRPPGSCRHGFRWGTCDHADCPGKPNDAALEEK